MESNVERAKDILLADSAVLYGIFGVIENSGHFPPDTFLNEFLMGGHDPCDQDYRMPSWKPFSLSHAEYAEVKDWWVILHPGTQESNLGADCWDDWIQEILDPPSA